MNWFTGFLTSSLGKKLIMSLTGLFLMLFLIIHLLGNLQLLAGDQGQSFNAYAEAMTHNPLIKVISYTTYALILLHAVQGIILSIQNRRSRGSKYGKKANQGSSWASRQMALLGILIFAFLLLHMGDFWYQFKFGDLALDQWGHKDLFTRVQATFSKPIFVGTYLLSMLVLAFHLWHGFESAFQTLGLRHHKYTGILKSIGRAYAILIPIGFAIIPFIFFIQNT